MLKYIATYILVLFSFFSKAQTIDTFRISGVVVSAYNRQPIPDGILMLTSTKGSPCDSSGKFAIYGLTKGEYTLTYKNFDYPNADTIVTINNSNILNFIWPIKTQCNGEYNKQRALDDIKDGKANLLVSGSIAPIIYSTDKAFTEKYKIGYDIFGCVPPDMQQCLVFYNQTIFKYLDAKYGRMWRKDVRKDVIGLGHN
ncbi:MAG: hypothetical protein EPN39_01295 [Chitinophagaceae bacterium]|nr:MAG: hypothetical protein EPN39_01295 [Chitinophagaceae bacterium]